MSKLSEPVAKALQALLHACKGDTKIVTRIITGNHSAHHYSFKYLGEIHLLRSVPYDEIVLALAQFIIASSDAPKSTEQPSAAAAVEGILTEEQLKLREAKLNKIPMSEIHRTMLNEIIASSRSYLSANAELSFKNKMLKESLTNISTHVGDTTSTDFFYDAYQEVKQLAYITLGDHK